MMKRYFLEAEDYSGVGFVDGKGKMVYIDETAFDEPLTLDVAKVADYSNFDGCEDAEEAAANYGGGDSLYDFNSDEWSNVVEF